MLNRWYWMLRIWWDEWRARRRERASRRRELALGENFPPIEPKSTVKR